YGFNKPVAQRIERSAEGTHLVAAKHTLLDCSVDGSVVNQRTARMVNEVGAVEMPRTQLGDLANGACDRVLVAFDAALRIVDRAQAFGDVITLLEGSEIGIELGLSGETVG